MNKSEIGQLGERIAEQHLIDKGYHILERNWRYSKAEIDIIAKTQEVLVFVEVKSRSYDHYGAPEESIDEKKETLIMDAAQRYMEKIDHQWEIRFDIISIIFNKMKEASEIRHYEDAFFH